MKKNIIYMKKKVFTHCRVRRNHHVDFPDITNK